MWKGLPVTPRGNAFFDFGREGEWLSAAFDLARLERVTNERKLDESHAWEFASGAVAKLTEGVIPGSGTESAPGKAVVWSQLGNEGRHAWEFRASGYRVVVDAETGTVLNVKDLRHF